MDLSFKRFLEGYKILTLVEDVNGVISWNKILFEETMELYKDWILKETSLLTD